MPKKILIPVTILFSGLCWYTSFDLSLHWWGPIWLAPAGLLYLAPRLKSGQTFLVAFLALLIGRLAWLGYLLSVIPPAPAIFFTLIFPLVFGVLVLAAKRILQKTPPLIGCLAFPVLWSAFEFIQFLFSRDGTITSIASTQAEFLPLIQVSSVTGILGITFLLCLFPSAIAVTALTYPSWKKVRLLWMVTGSLMASSLVYGVVRLHERRPSIDQIVGLASVDMRSYKNLFDTSTAENLRMMGQYLRQVERLAQQGARTIVIPEKVIVVTDSTEKSIRDSFAFACRRLGITFVGGFTLVKKGHYENRAWVISPSGNFLANYEKVNLFEGEEYNGFSKGVASVVFPADTFGQISGIAICKDMDYSSFMRTYSRKGATLVYAPAWDFVRDGWLHSRIAIMRAVEDGYSLVRDAQLGRLTLSDDRGRVLAESSSEKGEASLIGRIGASTGESLYSRWGDWFGYLILAAACWMLALLFGKRSRRG